MRQWRHDDWDWLLWVALGVCLVLVFWQLWNLNVDLTSLAR